MTAAPHQNRLKVREFLRSSQGSAFRIVSTRTIAPLAVYALILLGNVGKVKLLTHVLSPVEYGIYGTFFNTAAFLGLSVLLGADRYVCRVAAIAEARQSARTLMSLLVPLGIVALSLAASSLATDVVLIKLCLVASAAMAMSYLLRFYDLGRGFVTRFNVLNLVQLHGWLPIALVWALFRPLTLQVICILITTNAAIIAIAQLASAPWSRFAMSGAAFRPWLAFSLPLLPMVFGQRLVYVVDRYALLSFSAGDELGNYTLSIGVTSVSLGLLSTLLDAQRSRLMGATRDTTTIRAEVIQAVVPIVLVAAVGQALFSGTIVRALASSSFEGAAALASAQAVVPLLLMFATVATFDLEREGRTKRVGAGYLGAVLVNVIANVTLVPLLGAWGATIAFIFAYLSLLLILREGRPLLGLGALKSSWIALPLLLYCFCATVLRLWLGDSVSGVLLFGGISIAFYLHTLNSISNR